MGERQGKQSAGQGFATRAIHAGEARDPATNAHNTPIYQTATFTFGSAEEMAAAMAEPFDNFFYSRTGNPDPGRARDASWRRSKARRKPRQHHRGWRPSQQQCLPASRLATI